MQIVTAQFDTIVYWAGGAGIAGVTISKTDEFLIDTEVATIHSVLEGTGESEYLTFVVTWPTPPLPTDIITFTYVAADGYYQDSGGVLMADKEITIRNCGQDLPPLVIRPLGAFETTLGVPITPIDVREIFGLGTGTLVGYTVTSLPTGLTFDGTFISGTPTVGGTYPTEVECETTVAPVATDVASWVIPLAPSVVTPIADQLDDVDTTIVNFDVTLGFDTGTGTPVVFTVDNAPPGLLFDGQYLNGTLNTVGTYPTVTVTCSTGVSPDAVDVFEWEVAAVAPSVVTPIADQSDDEGTVIVNFDVTAGFDTGSGTPVVFTVDNLPPGLVFDGTQYLNGTLSTAGTYSTITVTCSTGVLPDAVDVFEWVVNSVAVPWTPAEVTTRMWLDISDTGTVSTGPSGITQVDDKSGLGNHAIQPNTSFQPTLVAAALNGLDVASFDGSESMYKSSLTGGTTNSLFLVFKPDTISGYRTIVNGQYTASPSLLEPYQTYITALGELRDWRTSALSPAMTAGQWALLSHTCDSLFDVRIWLDGVIGTVGTTGTSLTGTRDFYIGQAQTFGALGWAQGDLAELVMLPTDATTDVRQKMEGYLAWKWGLEGNLPVGHPYKSAAPLV